MIFFPHHDESLVIMLVSFYYYVNLLIKGFFLTSILSVTTSIHLSFFFLPGIKTALHLAVKHQPNFGRFQTTLWQVLVPMVMEYSKAIDTAPARQIAWPDRTNAWLNKKAISTVQSVIKLLCWVFFTTMLIIDQSFFLTSILSVTTSIHLSFFFNQV